MNNAISRINLDLTNHYFDASINIKKNDTARAFWITLSEHSEPYVLSEECEAVLKAKLPNGSTLSEECTVSDDAVVVYQNSGALSAQSGIVDCEILITGDDGMQITTPSFTVLVEDIISGNI